MNEAQATSKADTILLRVLESQNVISASMFNEVSAAEDVADSIAAFRLRLINKLIEQPA